MVMPTVKYVDDQHLLVRSGDGRVFKAEMTPSALKHLLKTVPDVRGGREIAAIPVFTRSITGRVHMFQFIDASAPTECAQTPPSKMLTSLTDSLESITDFAFADRDTYNSEYDAFFDRNK